MTEGARRVASILKKQGYLIGIVSDGIDYFGKYLQNKWELTLFLPMHLK